MTAAFSRVSPSRSARIFVAVVYLPIVRPRSRRRSHVQAGRTLAPQEIGEQQGSPARAEIAEDVSFKQRAIIRLYPSLCRCLTRNLPEFFRGVFGVSRSAIRPNKS